MGLVLIVLLSFATSGAAADRVKIADGIDMRWTSLAMDGDRLAWADETKQIIEVYTISSGKTEIMKLPVKPHDIRLIGQGVYFLGEEGCPYYLHLKTGEVRQLDTISADGIAGDRDYIAWYNADRVIVHNLRLGKRSEYEADQVIRDAAISRDTLVYVDGFADRRDLLYVVNLRNGQRRSYALQNIVSLAVDYPFTALTATDGREESDLRLMNLETEHEVAVENIRRNVLFQSHNARAFSLTSNAVVFQSGDVTDNLFSDEGIFLYEFDKNRTENISRNGIQPVISKHWAAWLEDGGIWILKYR